MLVRNHAETVSDSGVITDTHQQAAEVWDRLIREKHAHNLHVCMHAVKGRNTHACEV